MIFAVFDPSPLTVCINCSFFTFMAYKARNTMQDCWPYCCFSVLIWFFWKTDLWLSFWGLFLMQWICSKRALGL